MAPLRRLWANAGVLFLAACSHGGEGSASPDGGGGTGADAGGDHDGDASGAPACSAATCNGTTGLASPLCACSASSACACENVPFCNPFCPDAGTLSTSIDLPSCKTTTSCPTSRLVFDDGAPTTWTDGTQQRAYCLYSPVAATPTSQRPLLVFVHGSGGSADDVYGGTSLRSKAATFDLVGDGTRIGFFLASDQGRNLPNPNGNLGAAPRHDVYFRDLASPSQNPDVRAIDHIIDTVAGGGAVDPKRIFLVGWSNGAFFSAMYAIARYSTATPGGFHVAGAAVYAGGDPFDDPLASENGACSTRPYPQAATALYVIHRGCDSAVACDATQQQLFSDPPGYDVSDWVQTLKGSVGATVQEIIISPQGLQVSGCNDDFSLCTSAVGLINHISWPDGLAAEDAKYKNDWEGAAVGTAQGMLAFLAAHPHP